ncbi:hypothetical protein ACGFZP_12850 [Kitasatospora sp. NPDC048239]|uniref:hypothetical protein n=1 Tax=Kitasatospora sp. NPDC048239 TaxID=3364046 RepID=UPI0037109F8D
MTAVQLCENVALTYKPSPHGGEELDEMIHCQADATTTRWISRGTSREKLRNYCEPHASQGDAFVQKLRDGLVRAFAKRGEEPIVHHTQTRVCVTATGQVGTVTGLPSRHWGNQYFVHIDGTPYDQAIEVTAAELDAVYEPHAEPAIRSCSRQRLAPAPVPEVPVQLPPRMVTVRAPAHLL